MGNFLTNHIHIEVADEQTGLSPHDINEIQKFWKPLYDKAGNIGVEVFLRIFHKDPKTRSYFKVIDKLTDEEIKKSAKFKAHAINLMSAINMVVLNLHDPEVVSALMQKLGESHRRHRVKEHDFETFKQVILDFFQTDLKASPQLVSAWTRTVDFMIKELLITLKHN